MSNRTLKHNLIIQVINIPLIILFLYLSPIDFECDSSSFYNTANFIQKMIISILFQNFEYLGWFLLTIISIIFLLSINRHIHFIFA